jgi:hypothetical protein
MSDCIENLLVRNPHEVNMSGIASCTMHLPPFKRSFPTMSSPQIGGVDVLQDSRTMRTGSQDWISLS